MLTLLGISLSAAALVWLLLLLQRPLLRRYRARTLYTAALVLMLALLVPWRPQVLVAPVALDTKTISIPIRAQASPEAPGPAGPVEAVASPEQNVPVEPAMEAPRTLSLRWDWLLACIWIAGALIALLRQIARHARFLRLLRRWRTPLDAETRAQIDTLCAGRGVAVPDACRAPLVSCPTVVGMFKPVLLLPMDGEPVPELVLLHELCHIKRRDLMGKALIELALCVHWFNPALQLARRGMASLCEIATDEEALQGHGIGERRAYLLAMARALEPLPLPLSTGFRGGARDMKSRMNRVLDETPRRSGIAIVALALLLALVTGGVLAEAAPQAERLPPEAFDQPYMRMTDEEYDYVMGLKPGNLDELTLEQWHEMLQPELAKLKGILGRCALENGFMRQLASYDFIEMAKGTGGLCSAGIDTSINQHRAGQPDRAMYLSASVYWRLNAPDKLTVGQRNAIMEQIDDELQDEAERQMATGTDRAAVREAVRSLADELGARLSTDAIEVSLALSGLEVRDREPLFEMPQEQRDYLLSLQKDGYLDMSVAAFRRALEPELPRIREALQSGWFDHHFVRTLWRTTEEIDGLSEDSYIVSGGMMAGYSYSYRWQIADPETTTVGERDAALAALNNRVWRECGAIARNGPFDAALEGRIAQACEAAASELSTDAIQLTITRVAQEN